MGRVSDARQRLLDATLDLIWRQSYGAVTVDAICDKAGVKKGSFYHFFRSKSELVLAALDLYWSLARPDLDRIFAPTVPPATRLRDYLEFVYARQMELQKRFGRVPGCPYCAVGSEISNFDATICGKIQELIANYTSYLEIALRDMQRAGQLHGHEPAGSARALFAYIHGLLGHARIHDDAEIIRTGISGAFKILGVPEAPSSAASLAPRRAGEVPHGLNTEQFAHQEISPRPHAGEQNELR